MKASINEQAPEDLQSWQKRVEASEAKFEKHIKSIKESRKYAVGMDSSGNITTPANVILATNQAMLPHIYAKNPDVSVSPSKRAGESGSLEYEPASRFSETAEILLNVESDNARLKKVAKGVIRAIQTSRVGIVKVGVQFSYHDDPEIQSRINDTQDNIARMNERVAYLEDKGSQSEDEALKIKELGLLVESLTADLEVKTATGMVLDRIKIEDFILDDAVEDLYDYDIADWMGHKSYRKAEYVREKYNVDADYTDACQYYTKERTEYREAEKSSNIKKSGYVCIIEIWDHTTMSVWTWCEGADDYLRDPYQPKMLGQRWFPFFLLGHHWVDGYSWPLSDVEQLKVLQDEYTETRKQERSAREMNKPYMIFDTGNVELKDAQRMTKVGDREMLGMDFNGMDGRQLFFPGVTVPMNPAVYDTSHIRADIDWVSGVPDATRGSIVRAKTATEAGMQQSGMGSRVGERQDETEDWLTEIYQYGLQLLLQAYDEEQVREIVGENAFWPDLRENKEKVYNLVEVQVRAGSTGKPDKIQEQETWSKVLETVLQLTGMIMQLRMQGMPDDQNPYYQILKLTLGRFDERISIENIIPPMEQPEPDPMGLPGQMPQQPVM